MVFIDACGVNVNFPFEPYDCQQVYIKKVIECLKHGVNGILESPTGTGKTLCLLCGSLSWLEDKKAQVTSQQWRQAAERPEELDVFKAQLADKLDQAAGAWGGETAAPKIIYASRTHSQLSQVIQELKRTAYRHVRVAVLGSREQMCIHPQVMKEESNMAKVHLCRAKVSARTCHFYNNVENQVKNFQNHVMDIEDLVLMGKKHNCCPYYVARELKTNADIIFLPYNYLLDPKSRKAHGVQLQGNAIIFDEAHNLESICEDSASFDFTSCDLAAAIDDLKDLSGSVTEMIAEERIEEGIGAEGPSGLGQDFTLRDIFELKTQLHDLESRIDALTVPMSEEGATFPGKYIFKLFEEIKVTFTNKTWVIDLLDKMVAHLANGSSSSFNRRGAGLSKYTDILKIIFSRDLHESSSISSHQERVSNHYKVNVRNEMAKQRSKTGGGWNTMPVSSKAGRVLSYWCFSSGHTMEELMAQGVRCIILTSGTLSPISSFCTEMAIDFEVRLENPHVIAPHQVWVGAVAVGPDGVALSSSYTNRFKSRYQSSLGNAIVNFARVIPDGMLLFFPSYSVMDLCVANWQSNDIWRRIEQYKPVSIEPKGKEAFLAAMDHYYETVNDVKTNGAVFAAVCRGKVSEGLDFSDNNGRAVIITGLPFPPRRDPKVMLKMKFLDEMHVKNRTSLTGQQWYRQQASRAVNQAIGRVIRHRHDYGAIILCDERFSSADAQSQLPAWIRPACQSYPTFGRAIRDMMLFFRKCQQLMPAVQSKKKKLNDGNIAECQGVHSMPSTSRNAVSRLGPVVKASGVEVHVKSLRREKESNDVSIASMASQYAGGGHHMVPGVRRGLLEALDHSQARRPAKLQVQSHVQTTTSIQMTSEQQQNQRKKISVTHRGIDETSCEKSGETLLEFVKKIKTALSVRSYEHFKSTVRAYHASNDVDAVVSGLATIFTDDPKKYPLLRAFYPFVRAHHREKYDARCRDLTGEGCAPQQQADVAARKRSIAEDAAESETKEKKQKLSTAGVVDSKTHSMDTKTQPNGALSLVAAVSLHGVGMAALAASLPKDQCSVPTSSTTHDNGPVVNRAGTDVVPMSAAFLKERLRCIARDGPRVARTRGVLVLPTDEDSIPGPTCCYCHLKATVPLQAFCKHVCCINCWKVCILETRKCPECGKRVKRRHLSRIRPSSSS